MSDNLNELNKNRQINEVVCIDTKRIYDSCVSKDCLENLRVTFTEKDQKVIDEASSVKCCCSEVKAVATNIDEVPFNKGFYQVTIKLYFKLKFEVNPSCFGALSIIPGYATFEKKCILYGGEGSAKMFTSNPVETISSGNCSCGLNVAYPKPPVVVNPIAKLQTVDPVVLECELVPSKHCEDKMDTDIPSFIIDEPECSFPTETVNSVYVTLGLFSIIQLERDVQMLIPAYDFCVPDKECCCSTQNPCETFKKIDFPVDEFFPPNKDDSCCCDCKENS